MIFFLFTMIFQRFRRNKLKRKGQNHCYCSKTVVTVAKPPYKTARGGDFAGFAKFRGKLDRFIVEGVN
jgi:hypothetical protein